MNKTHNAHSQVHYVIPFELLAQIDFIVDLGT